MIILLWLGFIVFILMMLAMDLGIFNRDAHVLKIHEAILWTLVWISLAMVFNVVVYYLYEYKALGIGTAMGHELTGSQAALQFFTGYIIEKSLSLDNIFVIAMIFAYFRIRPQFQHRILYWGVLGALIMRGVMIGAGTVLISMFTWTTYIFGALLIVTAIKMLITRHDNLEPEQNLLVRLTRRLYPVHEKYSGGKFFTQMDGRHAVTPLFLVLLVIESTDVLFAVDSIPAIFAVTQDPFLVFTSNIFAILGLRSLYFFLAAVLDKFRYLKMSLVFVLAYIGTKMIIAHHYPIPTSVSLAFIAGTLSVGIFASIVATHRDTARLRGPKLPGGAAAKKIYDSEQI